MLMKKCLVESFFRSKNNRFTISGNGCYLCWCNLSDTDAYQSHMKQHLESVKVSGFNACWKSLGNQELIGLDVTVHQARIAVNLINHSDGILTISQLAVFNEILIFDLIEPDAFPIKLMINEKVTLKRQLDKLCGQNHITIVYEATMNNVKYEAVQSYRIEKEENEPQLKEELSATRSVEKQTKPPMNPKYQGCLELGILSDYTPTVEIKSLFKVQFKRNGALTGNEEKLRKTITEFNGPLTPLNYYDMLTLMVQIEDYGSQLSVMRCTKTNRSLVKVKGNEYVLKLHEREGRPLFVLAGDLIWIGKPQTTVRTYGVVQYATSSEMKIKFQSSNKVVEKTPIYSMHFEMNRLTFKLQRLALETAKWLNIIDLLFPQSNQIRRFDQSKMLQLDIRDKRLKSDTHQIEAVHNIVAGTAYPLPYVLIGFPGTGKTATIVESIYQLWKLDANNKILVCAQSNSVCDEIAQRLLDALPRKSDQQQHNIIRLFAACVRKSCNSDDLRENSNFDEGNIPSLHELYKYRIVIATLTVSGRLLQANMDSTHFTHLFIDECESATESFTLLPIALCSSTGKINAHIVLSGDPNQLGPVVREDVARKMTMGTSMLKRLSENPLYQKNKSNSYDRRITCRLRNNYRSHHDLVDMANKLFYNNEMKSCMPKTAFEKICWMSELEFMPKKGFPILFEHVDGIPEIKENCSSYYNEIEVESVLHYVEKLLQNEPRNINQSDIGVIAAYKRQVIHITECLQERNYGGIEVGTVEQFQGREKPIIIISTVRNGSLGFIQQRERINVLLTRAMGLLIVIGHVKTLRKNSDWRKIIDHTSNICGGEIVADYGYDVGDYRC